MTPAARLSAAIEAFADIEARRRPAGDALKDWGLSHRFAGSGDRAAIAGLVYDALRRKASSAWLMGEASPRAVLIGMLRRERGLGLADIETLCSGGRFAPPPLTDAEKTALESGTLANAPAHVQGDYPDWLDPYLARMFGDERAAEGEGLASRAPLDLRVNTLMAERDDISPRLEHLGAEPTRWSPVGLRIRLAADAKSPAIHAEPPFLKGQIEIQDEGSQLAALLAGAQPGEQVIDLCAGAGGKTLALAAAMENHGQIYATDSDKRRLSAIHERIARAEARNIQVRTPKGGGAGAKDILSDLAGRADLVLIDAPCTGTGTWRRNPDAKWRVRPGSLAERLKQQETVLERASGLAKPGGRVVYVTCSTLVEENGDQIRAFAGRHPDFSVEKPTNVINALGERAYLFRRAVLISDEGLLMTPRRTDTDGFFVSMLRRSA
ncbi:MAG TPA: RsmB/NOP family class I SAM-dependent RNA methyltransferase [Xanthobacteraceae bacterium]|jgi:16S rRNA (cytosine967-C5)-methyltransferase|nr:RsmB/NOP family class I SAM-dependent RNA methyltransferase [Xanthobacteraceae bacterium]